MDGMPRERKGAEERYVLWTFRGINTPDIL